MILVARPATVPRTLARGVAVTVENCALRDAEPIDYESGARKFSFIKSIYGPVSVKNSLAKAQHYKCCFCEGEFQAHVAGDVEHFRPKKSVQIGTARQYPGYYWLAYTFSNLYFACSDCNQYRKSDRFPLEVEGARARNHNMSIDAEEPLLLDPGGPRNPRDHIRFANDFPVGLTDAGRETVKILKLDREPLNKRRRTVLGRLKADRDTIELWEDDTRPEAIARVNNARQALLDAVSPEAEFSAAAEDFLDGWSPA